MISLHDLYMQSFRNPGRKDRVGDSHGWVLKYVKESVCHKRRADLAPQGIECIWIELVLKHKNILFNLFYRPPNSDSVYYLKLNIPLILQ